MLFKGKISKTKFEAKLIKHFGYDRLFSRGYVEDGKPMTLYYVEGGHAGTWMSSEGWIFDKANIEANINSMKKIMEAK